MSDVGEIAEGYDQKSDFYGDMGGAPLVSSNLSHLTLSETIMEFMKKEPLLHPLIPLADQICATNLLDERGIALHKAMVDSAILRIKIYGDEDNQTGQAYLNTARIYLHQLIDGCLDGYRGRIATEVRRHYTTETMQHSPQKRRWGS